MFFDQIKEIDGSIKDLRDHLKNIGVAVDEHFDQLDDIAAHIIALEAIMIEVIKKVDIDADAAKEWVRENTEESTGNEGGSKKAPAVIDELVYGNKITPVAA
ncbi:MAG: hypothetical protein HQ503_16720 [Rhodospirillales bacterium]|nr:hypothetical protein [Rhodospirillales bacterium]